LTANKIAESLYSQCDPDGNHYVLLEEIVDYRRLPTAVKLSDQKTVRANGKTYLKRSTVGWQLCCQWRDGSTSWENLADLKESHPIETAEYAKILGIDHEPAFNWWVPHVLKKRDRIISLVRKRNPRYLKRTHKFGIELPKTVKEAFELDKKNGNTLWADAIAKEMRDVRVAFKILPDGQPAPVGYQRIPCHMIFDIKMEDFRRKARLVAGGHMTKAPATITYASVVSRETVRIALLMAALNDLNVKVGDVLNAYITAPITEKVWTVLGPEFGTDAGKRAIIVRALYGLKSAGAAFRAHLASFMRQMGYTSCKADPDLWYKAETRPSDNFRYYAYILCYVDDILCVHHDPMSVLNLINGYMPLKPSSVGDPDIYLGAKLKLTRLNNGVWAWGLSPSKYVAQAVKNCAMHLTDKLNNRFHLPRGQTTRFPMTITQN
jgi:Reverse transcriptase (RNA-dependent DNA polymerase).